MDYKFKYGGMSVEKQYNKFSDVFEETYDEERFITKKVFRHSEPGLSFKYRYVFDYCWDEDDKTVHTELLLVVEPQSFCKAKRREMLSDCGFEDMDDASQLNVIDVVTSGLDGVVPMERESVPFTDLESVKDTVASIVDAVDSLRGFYIDRNINLIGTTGWDVIKSAKGLIKDPIQATMNRWKKQMKDNT